MTTTFHVILVGVPSMAAMDGPPGLVTAVDHLRRDNPCNQGAARVVLGGHMAYAHPVLGYQLPLCL